MARWPSSRNITRVSSSLCRQSFSRPYDRWPTIADGRDSTPRPTGRRVPRCVADRTPRGSTDGP